MNRQRALTVVVGLLVAAITVVSVALIVRADDSIEATFPLVPLTFAWVGGFLVVRRPANVESWIVLLVALVALPSWLVPFSGAWVPPVGLMGTQLLLRFPNGRLPSARWRWFSRFTIVAILVETFVLTSIDRVDEAGLTNPYYVGWVHWLEGTQPTLLICMVISAASLVMRYRAADTVERQQLRWIAWSGGTVAFLMTVSIAAGPDAAWPADGWLMWPQTATQLSFTLLPLSIGFAILKYRLYDIDRLISRTAAYGLVTGMVLATYSVIIALVSFLPVSSSLSVAAATLTAAAITRPGYARIQAFVDRRFNRAKYDATRTVEAFGSSLRDVVDPDVVVDELVEVVNHTLMPADTTIWLRASK